MELESGLGREELLIMVGAGTVGLLKYGRLVRIRAIKFDNLKASPMPPAPLLAVCSEAASASSTIWYRVCTNMAPGPASFGSSRFGTRSVFFRVPDDVPDLIAGLVPDRRPDLVQDLGQDLSDRSGTRFGLRDLVRLESDLASDQVPDLAPDQLPDLVQDVAPDFVPIRANSVRNVVPVGCQTW